MTLRINGPGANLPIPTNLFPFQPGQSYAPNTQQGQAFNQGTNTISLAAGQTMVIPAGDWMVEVGSVGLLQYYDPVMLIWRGFSSARQQAVRITSDGFNFRLANLTGCPIAGVVTGAGGSYAQSTATITPSTGGSTWQAIVGGAVNISGTFSTVIAAGGNYGLPPIVVVSAPPAPGVPATAIAVLASSSVASIMWTNQGAGYTSTPTLTLITDPSDPNFGSITVASISAIGLYGAGSITAALCTNPGLSLGSAPTVSLSGGSGTNGTVAVVWMNTLTLATVSGAGTGYSTDNEVVTVGGRPTAAPIWTNPRSELTGFIPRPYTALAASSSGTISSISATYDTGLFATTAASPSILIISPASSSSIGAALGTIAGTFGGTTETVTLQEC